MFSVTRTALLSMAGLGLSFAVVGCQPERPDVIPSSAQMWTSGNEMLHYQSPADGTVYIYDHASQRLIWSGRVMKGQSVDVDTQKMQIMAGGQIVVNKLSAPGNQKDIYFDPAPVPQQQPTWNNNNPNNSGAVTVTPNVTVQPSNGTSPSNGVTVQPGVTVSPAPQTPPQ